MDIYDDTRWTHKIVAVRDSQTRKCKESLLRFFSERATSFYAYIHSTETEAQPKEIDSLEIDSDVSHEDFVVRRGELPDARKVVEAIITGVDDGGIGLSALQFSGSRFEALVIGSSQSSRVGKLCTQDEAFLGEVRKRLGESGIVAPTRSVGWSQSEGYVEIRGDAICVFEEKPSSEEDRLYTTHSCYDLRRVSDVHFDENARRIELDWQASGSVMDTLRSFVFKASPSELVVPSEKYDVVREHLLLFTERSVP